MSKKVLILVNHDIVIYNFRKELVERLLLEGHQVYISSPNGERILDLINLGCEYIESKIDRHGTNPFKEIKLLNHYNKLMKDIRPDVVLSYTIKPNIYGGMAAVLNKIPYIVNITGLGSAVENKSYKQTLSIFLYKIALSKVERVFFQNTENMSFFRVNKIAINKHHLLPGSGVNLKEFSLMDYPGNEVIEFVFISRIMKEKGIEEYIKSAEVITKKYPKTKFHVCGFCEEEYEERLKDLESKGVLTYHGMLRDIKRIIGITHCTVHPTFYPEGLSNVLLESAACGRPLISTNRSGCREVIDNGENGYLVAPRNTEDLINKIEKFILLQHEEKYKMGVKSRAKVEKEFDRNNVVDKYIRIINQL